ncbi:MAG: prephenate dehydrogenase/arogenate dehydrogenase family protein [Lentisphaeria bacterium]|nr:prephenate dehydrogenase/arogenate dehydrogenase family protein [Lentisphaeria bacterium]NQZ68714.1 prephenate dehydrogenase/arogenate dehydrogenase family protein [Lentisphaeria bacterium]
MSTLVSTSRIAVVGLGQLGASLAMRFSAMGCINIFGVARRVEVIQALVDADHLDGGGTDPKEIIPVVDICFICLPLTQTIEFIKTNLDHFRAGSIVTDVGSVKGSIVDEVRQLLWDKGVYFIGSHPMVGTEKTGYENANADLYKDSICFITPTEDDEPDAINILATFWSEIGATVMELDAERHDLAVANSSHVLHLLSANIVRAVNNGDMDAHAMACAGGFRDTTRIASSDPNMWTEITKHNKSAILNSLSVVEDEIQSCRKLIEADDWDGLNEYLKQAKDQRDAWLDEFGCKRGYK